MKTITLHNEKGGVGKTTAAIQIAAGLAIRGKRVILIDTDASGNATSAVGLEQRPDFYDLIVRNARWPSVLREPARKFWGKLAGPSGHLYVVGSNEETRNIASLIANNWQIRNRLREMDRHVDYVVIDTSPAPSLLHTCIALASDIVIIPTECEGLSAFGGVKHSVAHIQNIRDAAAQGNVQVAQTIAILPNRFDARTATHNSVLESLQHKYGAMVWEPLNEAIIIAEAQLFGQSVFGYAPEHRATEQMWQVIDRLQVEVGV